MKWYIRTVIMLLLLVFISKAFELQLIKGEYFREISENNRVRRIEIQAPRGRILARGGEILADNKAVKKTVIFDEKTGYQKVASENTIGPTFNEYLRQYIDPLVAPHVLGYLGETTEEKLNKVDPNCPEKGVKKLGNMFGVSGLEYYYDCTLRGINGDEIIEVDILGKKIRSIGQKAPIQGTDIQTTIDFKLQKKISEALGDKIGAIVATDGKGQVIGLYSNPSFDPNAFNVGPEKERSALGQIFQDPTLPLFDRAISGTYHPGSIFKIITGISGLEERVISPDFSYVDNGVISVNGFDYSTWYFTQYGKTEGAQNFRKALSRSTDTFFYNLGQLVGINKMVDWARKFNVGTKSGIDLPGESDGLLPSPEWKEKTLGERWYLGNTFHFSIGQGDLLLTPIQANLITSVIANGGYICEPHLNINKKSNCRSLELNPLALEEVKKGMIMACSPGGTAYPFFDFQLSVGPRGGEGGQVACKTGTAETGEKSPPHAWFTIFAPVNDPEIVLTVLLEKGGEGSSAAAPIAREILDYWFYGKEKPAR